MGVYQSLRQSRYLGSNRGCPVRIYRVIGGDRKWRGKKRRVTVRPRAVPTLMMWQYFIKHTGTQYSRAPRLQRFAFISLDFSTHLRVIYSPIFTDLFQFYYTHSKYILLDYICSEHQSVNRLLSRNISDTICE